MPSSVRGAAPWRDSEAPTRLLPRPVNVAPVALALSDIVPQLLACHWGSPLSTHAPHTAERCRALCHARGPSASAASSVRLPAAHPTAPATALSHACGVDPLPCLGRLTMQTCMSCISSRSPLRSAAAPQEVRQPPSSSGVPSTLARLASISAMARGRLQRNAPRARV